MKLVELNIPDTDYKYLSIISSIFKILISNPFIFLCSLGHQPVAMDFCDVGMGDFQWAAGIAESSIGCRFCR